MYILSLFYLLLFSFFISASCSSLPVNIPETNPNKTIKKYPSWKEVKPGSPGSSHLRRKCSNEDKPRKDEERIAAAKSANQGIELYKTYKKQEKLNKKHSKKNNQK